MSLVRSAIRPVLFAHRGALRLPSVPISRRLKSTLVLVDPSPSAAREVPTPLVFISASRWTGSAPASTVFSHWIQHFQTQGYSSLVVDLDPDQLSSTSSSSSSSSLSSIKMMTCFQREMVSLLGSKCIFPLVLFSSGPSALIAQTFASSHPLTALQLIDPPISNQSLHSLSPELLHDDHLPEFNFELKFPVRVVWSESELQRHTKLGIPWYQIHRIEHAREEESDQALDRFSFSSDQQVVENTQTWLEDDVGVYRNQPIDENVSFLQDDESDLDQDQQANNTQKTPSTCLPTWFTKGSYTFQPNSTKYPITLDERDLSESFIRGSGPGGQAINKLSTNVELIHLPSLTRITCQETRSRQRNRELARRRMSLILEKLVKGNDGSSRIDLKIAKERKKKLNKKKKQVRRQREKDQQVATKVTSDDVV